MNRLLDNLLATIETGLLRLGERLLAYAKPEPSTAGTIEYPLRFDHIQTGAIQTGAITGSKIAADALTVGEIAAPPRGSVTLKPDEIRVIVAPGKEILLRLRGEDA